MENLQLLSARNGRFLRFNWKTYSYFLAFFLKSMKSEKIDGGFPVSSSFFIQTALSNYIKSI